LNLYDSIANLVLLEVGCVVFLSIEGYEAIKSTGELEKQIAKQTGYIVKLFTNIVELNVKIKQHGIDQDIIGSQKLDKDLIPGQREIRELAVRDFLSGFSLFGSNLTSMLNSLVIWLEIYDPIMAVIASAIPLVSWQLARGKAIDQRKQNILSYMAISSVVGQMAYFGVSFSVERTTMEWTLDGLLPFFIGFTSGMITLEVLTGDNYKIIIRSLYKPFRLKWNKLYNLPE
jgi:hypothetical protein